MRFILLVLLFAYVSSSCIEKRNEAMSDNRVGTYIPQCYDNNTWVNPQCHGSTGFCWCVTIEGREIPRCFVYGNFHVYKTIIY